MKNKETVGGSIELISLKKFLMRIGVAYIDSDSEPFNTMIKSCSRAIVEGIDSEECIYKRLMAHPNEYDMQEAALIGLGIQASHNILFYANPLELLEEAIVQQCIEYGEPCYAVRISKRKWLIANPEDYLLYRNNNGYSLACLAQNRTTVNEVLKITEQEALIK